jgi:glutamyl-Q tRNA(Asp) synthetase
MTSYTGRFAPSPTGPLHLGSLVAALGSYLDAKANSGLWLLRIEDIDPPREIAGAKELILGQLEAHGLHWDGTATYQSQRLDIYQEYFDQLKSNQQLFACDCPRHRIRDLNGIYDSHCRDRNLSFDSDAAIRVYLTEKNIGWNDLILGKQSFSSHELGGDFIVRRRDGLFSYQLAVALDDGLEGITHVIRGADLLDSTARQLYLHQLLGLASPEYGHLPMVMNNLGQKLSKQTHAPALESGKSGGNLALSLNILGLNPPEDIGEYSCEEILAWGISHWNINSVPTNPVEPLN